MLSEALAEVAAATDMSETSDGVRTVTAYFEDEPDRSKLESLARPFAGKQARPVIDQLDTEDWVAKSLTALGPVAVGRYVVHGGHDRDKRPGNAIAIEIDAATAFGTGHHGTTAGCLDAISGLAKRRRVRRALDLGCGSGILAIAIARTWHAPVLATDIDPVAVAVARANARLNRAPEVHVIRADGLRHRLLADPEQFELVTANILAGPLAAMAHRIARSLMPGGTAILSGLLPHQRRWILAAYRNQGLAFRRSAIRDGWLTLVMERPARPLNRLPLR